MRVLLAAVAALAALAAPAVLPAAVVAQAPPPDERAAAQAFADAAKRLLAAAEALEREGRPEWSEDCRALRRDPPDRREYAERVYLYGLVLRDLIGQLKPHAFRLRGELARAQTADPALISGRAAVRRLGKAIAAFPPGEADPCAAYAAYADAGYPRGPTREARALQRRLDTLVTRGMKRRILTAAERIEALGVSPSDAHAFGELAG